MIWAGAALGGVGAVLVLIAALLFGARRRHVARAERVEGTVVGSRARQTGNGARRRTVHHPIVRFVRAGQSFDLEGSVGRRDPRPVGTTITVLVDPAAPSTPLLEEPAELYATPLLLAVTGGSLLLCGAAITALS